MASARHNRDDIALKLWHLLGGMESVSKEQVLFTFYEVDNPTPSEINTIKNNKKVIVSSKYSQYVFKNFGCDNVIHIPLAFDHYNFKRLDKQYFNDGRITFGVVGKLEKRKHHAKVIQAWIRKYGGNPKYFLLCGIYNNFIEAEQQKQIYREILGGNHIPNVQFLGFMPTNAMYNDFLNALDIVIGMSGGEGFGLPEFQAVALGKHAVILNAHGYREWANPENAVLVNPNSKIEVYDDIFFRRGMQYNQGHIFCFDDEDFLAGCDEAIKRVESNRLNENGLELQSQFTAEKMCNSILQTLYQ